jgi:hypothetical protein
MRDKDDNVHDLDFTWKWRETWISTSYSSSPSRALLSRLTSSCFRRVIWKLGRNVFITHFWTSGVVGKSEALSCTIFFICNSRLNFMDIFAASFFVCWKTQRNFRAYKKACSYEDNNITILTQRSERSRFINANTHNSDNTGITTVIVQILTLFSRSSSSS